MSVRADRDPGLQAERTLLAWWRTTLAVAVFGAALAHLLPDVPLPVVLGIAVAPGLLALPAIAARRRAVRVLALRGPEDPIRGAQEIAWCAAATAAVGLMALILLCLGARR